MAHLHIPAFLTQRSHGNPLDADLMLLTERLSREVKHQFSRFEREGLDQYAFRRRPSHFSGAMYDLDIYDPNGRLIIQGREFYGGAIALWQPERAFHEPGWYTGHSPHVPPRAKGF